MPLPFLAIRSMASWSWEVQRVLPSEGICNWEEVKTFLSFALLDAVATKGKKNNNEMKTASKFLFIIYQYM